MSIHGHTVLNYLLENNPTLEQLREYCTEHFGSDAEYHTCSGNPLNFDELIQFFQNKNKFTIIDNKMVVHPSKICSH